ncbi:pilus assembly protein PilM [Sedimentibacter sp. LTW-03]
MCLFLSLEIYDEGIKIVEALRKSDSVTVMKCDELTGTDIIENGRIVDVNAVAVLIKNMIAKNGINTRRAVFTVNSASVISRRIKLPMLDKKREILSMIRNELEQLMPVDLNQYKIIYDITDIVNDNDVKYAFYVIYCLPCDIYKDCKELAKILKLKLASIDVSFNCLNKISKYEAEINSHAIKNDSIYAFLEINNNHISFCVLKNGVTEFSRISLLNEDMVIIEKAAEECAPYNTTKFIGLTPFVDKLMDELNRYIRYYYSMYSANVINKIFIYGDIPHRNIGVFLASNLGIETEIIEHIPCIKLNAKLDTPYIVEKYFICLLSLLNNKTNMWLSYDSSSDFRPNYKFFAAAISAASLAAILAAITWKNYNAMLETNIQGMKLYIYDEEKAEINTGIEDLKKEIGLREAYIEKVSKLKGVIRNENTVNSIIISEFFESVPNNTRLVSMSVNRNSTQISCVSKTIGEVTLFIQNLRQLDFIEDIYFSGIDVKNEEGSYSFSVMCRLKDLDKNEK